MIGERIRDLRKKRGLSQEQFAEMLGVSRQAVSKWETGEAVPETERIVQLCELLGVSSDYLLFGKEEVVQPVETNVPAPKKPSIVPAVIGGIFTALGGIGLLAIWVLSTMFISTSWTEVATTNLATGETYYTMQPEYTYTLTGFIGTHRLQALLLLCAAFLVVGVILLVCWWIKRRKTTK